MRKTGNRIASIVVALCLIGYYALATMALITINMPNLAKIAIIAVSVIITVVVIMVMIERLKEINKGETDDLGKY